MGAIISMMRPRNALAIVDVGLMAMDKQDKTRAFSNEKMRLKCEREKDDRDVTGQLNSHELYRIGQIQWILLAELLESVKQVVNGRLESTNELLSWLARGLFKVNISHSYKLQEVNRAFSDIKDRKAIGKVMIIFDDPKSISSKL
ncbi:hypothetical protein Tco_0889695 [Tanacetum coccineum]